MLRHKEIDFHQDFREVPLHEKTALPPNPSGVIGRFAVLEAGEQSAVTEADEKFAVTEAANVSPLERLANVLQSQRLRNVLRSERLANVCGCKLWLKVRGKSETRVWQ